MRVLIKSNCFGKGSWYKDKIGWIYDVEPRRSYGGEDTYILTSDLSRVVQRIIDKKDFVEVENDRIPQRKRGEL